MKLKLKQFRRKDLGKQTKSSNFLCPWSEVDPQTGKIKAKGMLKFNEVGQEHDVPDSVGHSILARFSDILEPVTAPQTLKKRVQSPVNK